MRAYDRRMMPRGNPYGLDVDTTERMVRSFLVVRIVRGGLLLLALAGILVGVEANRWPTGVAVAVVAALLLQGATLVANCRRYAHAGGLHHQPRRWGRADRRQR
jgi:hypothetical protein